MNSENGKIVFRGATVIDPASGLNDLRDILLDNGVIEAIDKPGSFANTQASVEDVAGKFITPGLVDIHVHLREPGQEWKETIQTGIDAAVAGGFTTICCMPNTKPVNDNAQVTEFMIEQAAKHPLCKVLPIGAISVGSKGQSLAPMMELREAGCIAFSDDGRPVSNAQLMRRALEYSLMSGGVLTVHEEDLNLSQHFSMNESALSLKLGLVGMPGAAEDVMIARDIELSRLTGAPVHFCHVSTARAVTLIRRAKEDGILVTAEVSPHHLLLDESLIGDFDTAYKMSMPLRSKQDIAALLAGLRDGVIDCIASDHAPHEEDSKRTTFAEASFGILGLQTTVPIVLELVRKGELSLERAIASLTTDAARCFKMDAPRLAKGSKATMTVIDPQQTVAMSAEYIRSKSKNTPFLNQQMQGIAVQTWFDGRNVYTANDLN